MNIIKTMGLTLAFTAGALAQAAEPISIGFQKGSGLLAVLKAQGTLEKTLGAQQRQVRWIEFPAGPQMLEALNTVTFTEKDGKTEMTLHAQVLRATEAVLPALDGMEEGWSQSLEKLAAVIATAASA